jgi:hypothetical protein
MKKLLIVLSVAALILAGCEELVNTLLPDEDNGKTTISQSLSVAGKQGGIEFDSIQVERTGETVITYKLDVEKTIRDEKASENNRFFKGDDVYKEFFDAKADGEAQDESVLQKNGKLADKNGGNYTIVSLFWTDLRRMLLSAGLTIEDTFVVNEVNPDVFQSGGIYDPTTDGRPYPKVNVQPDEDKPYSSYHDGWVAGSTHQFVSTDPISKTKAAYYFIAIDRDTDGKGGEVNGSDKTDDEYDPPADIELKFYKLTDAAVKDGKYKSDTMPIPELKYSEEALDSDQYRLVLVLKFVRPELVKQEEAQEGDGE